jgi:hypothetical protein
MKGREGSWRRGRWGKEEEEEGGREGGREGGEGGPIKRKQ